MPFDSAEDESKVRNVFARMAQRKQAAAEAAAKQNAPEADEASEADEAPKKKRGSGWNKAMSVGSMSASIDITGHESSTSKPKSKKTAKASASSDDAQDSSANEGETKDKVKKKTKKTAKASGSSGKKSSTSKKTKKKVKAPEAETGSGSEPDEAAPPRKKSTTKKKAAEALASSAVEKKKAKAPPSSAPSSPVKEKPPAKQKPLEVVTPRAKFISVAFNKDYVSRGFGLYLLKDQEGDVSIGEIQPTSIFASALRVDDKFFQVNGRICLSKSESDVIDILKEEKRGKTGTMTIVVINPFGEPDTVERIVLDRNGAVSLVGNRASHDLNSQASTMMTTPPSQLDDDTLTSAYNRSSDGRAKYISFTFKRDSEKTPLGMQLGTNEDGNTYITEIRPESMIANSPFRERDIIFVINDTECLQLKKSKVLAMMKETVGAITIVVINQNGNPDFVESMAEKTFPDEDVGLITRNKTGATLEISSVSPQGLFANSLLSIGDEILAINSNECNEPSAAHDLMDDAQRFVSVFAMTAPHLTDFFAKTAHHNVNNKNIDGRAKFKSFTFNRKSASASLGMSLGKDQDDDVYIAEIQPGGVIADSPLCAGDKIFHVNETNCLSLSKTKVISCLKESVGLTTIVVVNKNGNPYFIESMVEKKVSDKVVGLQTVKKSDGTLKVSFISPKGLFANSLLSIGDKILSINSNECDEPTVAQDLISDASRFVSVCAMTPTRLTKSFAKTTFAEDKNKDNRAAFISYTFKKDSESSLGMAMGRDEDGDVCITELKREGLLGKAPVRKNDKIFYIDNTTCLGMRKTQIADIIKEKSGLMTLAVINKNGNPHFVESMVKKSSSDVSTGLTYKKKSDGTLGLSKIEPKGLFENSLLSVGETVISINKKECDDPLVAQDLMSEEKRFVTVSAMAPTHLMDFFATTSWGDHNKLSDSRAKLISFTFKKESVATSLGLCLGSDLDGDVYITDIRPDGLVGNSSFRVGDKVFLVNKTMCLSTRKSKVSALLKEAIGMLTIVVINGNGNPDIIESMVEKSSSDAPVGVDTKKKGTPAGSRLAVSLVEPKGLFAKSLLSVGDMVLSVNSKECKDPIKFQEAVSKAPRFVSITAETPERLADIFATPATCENNKRSIDGRAKFISYSFTKESCDTPMGLCLGTDDDGDVCITDMDDGGLVGGSPLCIGDKIFFINETMCLSSRKSRIAALLQQSIGVVNIVVINPHGDPGMVESLIRGRRDILATSKRRADGWKHAILNR